MKKELCQLAVLWAALIFMTGCGMQPDKDNKRQEEQTEQVERATEESFEEKLLDTIDEEQPAVTRKYSETEEYPQLATFLIDYYEIPQEYQSKTRYYYNYTDLDEDGAEEIFALVVGEYTSKSSGDCAVILKIQEDGTFMPIASFENMHTPVTICDETVNGWHKIIYEVYGGVQDAGSMICHYEEEGGYLSDQNEFVEKLKPVAGTQILSNNLIDDMDQGRYLTLAPREETK